MYYVKHVAAAATAPLVLAACMLLAVAAGNGASGSALQGVACAVGCIAHPVLQLPSLTLDVMAAIVSAQLLFPLFLLVSTVIRNNTKVVSGAPLSVLITCVPIVLTAVVASIVAPSWQLVLHSFGWRGMLKVISLAVGCWGSYILYISIRPKQKL